jgi:hypothetical protein
MPSQKRNEGRQEYHYEEWQTSNSRCMPNLRHQDVQNWKELIWNKVRSFVLQFYKGSSFSTNNWQFVAYIRPASFKSNGGYLPAIALVRARRAGKAAPTVSLNLIVWSDYKALSGHVYPTKPLPLVLQVFLHRPSIQSCPARKKDVRPLYPPLRI